MKRFIVLLILVGLLLCGCALSDKRIRQIAAKEFDVPADKLEILARGKAVFRWSGQEVTTAKLVDIRNDKGYDLTIDAGKQGADKKKLIRENQESFSSRYGKIEPELFHLLRKSPKMRLKVGIWLHSRPRNVKSSDRIRENKELSDIRLRRKKLYQAAEVEKLLEEELIKNLRESLFVTFGVEPLLTYLWIRDAEVKNLRTVLLSKSAGVSPEEIKKHIRGFYG